VPEEYSGLLIEKGSIAIDGVSLTIGRVDRGACAVYVIPHTLGSTTLGSVRPGEKVNVEFDVLGKYILRNTMDRSPLRGSGGALHRMVRGSGQAPGAIRTTNITDSFLKEHGFPA
jgi:riboflavin synthase